MTTVKQHLDKVKKKAHSTQKKNGHYLKMTITNLSKRLKDSKNRITELETELVWFKAELKLHERLEKKQELELSTS